MFLTKNSTPVIGQIATLLGFLMNGIFLFTNNFFHLQNIGVCIILFTLVIYLLMTPLTIRQQKYSRLSALMNPEIQGIQKKYQGKKDQVSQMKMNNETQAVYKKYGVSPMGTCLPLLIQLPILFALYRVVSNIPAYVTDVKNAFLPLVNVLLKTDGSQEFLAETVSSVNFDKLGYTANSAIDALYKFTPANWTSLAEKFPDLSGSISQVTAQLDKMNYFIGLNISDSPISSIRSSFQSGNYLIILSALLIPVLAGLTQWINLKLSTIKTDDSNNNNSNDMGNSMRVMNNMMPLFSVVICVTLPLGIGIYWIAGAVIRSVQQVLINRYLAKMDIDGMIAKNVAKMEAKQKKRGVPVTNQVPQKQTISSHARINVKDVETRRELEDKKREEKREELIKKSTEYYNNANAKPGSIAAKARMVEQYNDKKKKK